VVSCFPQPKILLSRGDWQGDLIVAVRRRHCRPAGRSSVASAFANIEESSEKMSAFMIKSLEERFFHLSHAVPFHN
jgi:hypothetical protein